MTLFDKMQTRLQYNTIFNWISICSKVWPYNNYWITAWLDSGYYSSTQFEMSLMSFVCNFGGLLGMWLGFSILSISKDVFDAIRRFPIFNPNKITFINNCLNYNNILHLNLMNESISKPNQNNLSMIQIDI